MHCMTLSLERHDVSMELEHARTKCDWNHQRQVPRVRQRCGATKSTCYVPRLSTDVRIILYLVHTHTAAAFFIPLITQSCCRLALDLSSSPLGLGVAPAIDRSKIAFHVAYGRDPNRKSWYLGCGWST